MQAYMLIGGPVLWVILVLGVIAVGVFLERSLHLHRARIDETDFLQGIFNTIRRGNVAEAITLCEETPGPVARLLSTAMYTYDRYDMVDIAQLKAGDVLTIDGQEIAVASVERSEQSGVLVNGGLENGGYTLRTEEDGTFFVSLENDAKSWHALGEATIRVSPDFLFIDNAQQPPVTYYPGDFLVEGTGIDYDFTPYNTTVTIENGRIIAMNRVFVP